MPLRRRRGAARLEAGQSLLDGRSDRIEYRASPGRAAASCGVRAQPGGRRTRAGALGGRLAEVLSARLERAESIRRGSPDTHRRTARGRAPHRRDEQLLAGPVSRDRAGHRGLPREGNRLERHRLQLPRRQVRPGVRGPERRHGAQRHRRARQGFQHRDRSASRDRKLRVGDASTGRRASLVALLAWRLDVAHVDPVSTLTTCRTETRSFPAGHARVHARGLRPSRHGVHELPGRRLYRKFAILAGTARRPACRSSSRRGSRATSAGRSVHRPPLRAAAVDRDCLGSHGKIAAGGRTSAAIDWTWDARSAARGVRYTYDLAAGATVRGLRGVVGRPATTSPAPPPWCCPRPRPRPRRFSRR